MNKKKGEDDFEAKERAMWDRAFERVIRFVDLRRDDYDFKSWAKGASAELLEAGCAFEYARESYYFRCSLVLLKRGMSFNLELKGSTERYLEFSDKGWDTWLTKFAEELIANRSFAEVLRRNPTKVQKSLGKLPLYSFLPKAVELPGCYDANHPGSRIVPVQFFFERYNNNEIGEEMKRLAKKLRPAEWPEPEPRGKEKQVETLSLLDALSAMRLASHMRKRDAVKHFSEIQLGGVGREGEADVALSNFNKLARKARAFFASIFPYGEAAENSQEFSSRNSGKRS
jgi:hypothetical protein